MIVEIDPKRWIRGEGDTKSALLTDDGRMCCLGFVACALGHTLGEIEATKTPGALFSYDRTNWNEEAFVKWHNLKMVTRGGLNSTLARQLFEGNDSFPEIVNPAERVEKLNVILSNSNSPLRFKLKED